jgi:hypothetical protein
MAVGVQAMPDIKNEFTAEEERAMSQSARKTRINNAQPKRTTSITEEQLPDPPPLPYEE